MRLPYFRPVLGWRIWRLENRLRKENERWQLHCQKCTRCTTIATGSRAQRRQLKGRFCAEGGALILRLEDLMDGLKALYARKKVLTLSANPGQEGQ